MILNWILQDPSLKGGEGKIQKIIFITYVTHDKLYI